jgi:hypothetical protein
VMCFINIQSIAVKQASGSITPSLISMTVSFYRYFSFLLRIMECI